MAIIAKTTFVTSDSKSFLTQVEAEAHELFLANKAEIEAFVAKHFPGKDNAKRGNPHAGTASKAVALWIAEHQ